MKYNALIMLSGFLWAQLSFGEQCKPMPELANFQLIRQAEKALANNEIAKAKKIALSLNNAKKDLGNKSIAIATKKLLAKVAQKQGDHELLIKATLELKDLGGEMDVSHLFHFAASLKARGKESQALEINKQLILKHPSTSFAAKVEKETGLLSFKFKPEELEKRFDKLLEDRAFQKVVSDVELLLKDSALSAEQRSIFNGFLIKALIWDNRYLAALKRAQTLAKNPKSLARDVENYAWSLSKVDRFIEAANNYLLFSQRATSREDKARGCFFAGFSLYEASLYEKAEKSWQKCEKNIKKSTFAESYYWYRALSRLLHRDTVGALHWFVNLRQFKNSPEIEKYQYFTALALRQHDKKSAMEVLRALSLASDPSYYSLLARRSLGLPSLNGQLIEHDAFSRGEKGCNSQICQQVLQLNCLGFSEEARNMLLSNPMPPEPKLAMLQFLGEYHEVWRRAYLIKPELKVFGKSLIAKPAIRASYPMPHLPFVKESSQKYKLPKSLIFAIMRTESGFKSQALSDKGAMGVMQMMPFMASDLAEKRIESFNAAMLNDPKVAIELGALLLASLKRQFDNTLWVAAAYNAGSARAQQWQDRFGELEAEELLIERIPYSQTRNYIKKVLLADGIYRALDGEGLWLEF